MWQSTFSEGTNLRLQPFSRMVTLQQDTTLFTFTSWWETPLFQLISLFQPWAKGGLTTFSIAFFWQQNWVLHMEHWQELKDLLQCTAKARHKGCPSFSPVVHIWVLVRGEEKHYQQNTTTLQIREIMYWHKDGNKKHVDVALRQREVWYHWKAESLT